MAPRNPLMKNGTSRKAIIVIGSGRSGTSLVMQILNYLGIYSLGEVLKENVTNPKGFLENTRVLEIHQKLLKSIMSHSSLPLLPGWMASPEAAKAKAALIGHIHSNIADKQIFAVKDPRISILIPLWREVLATFSLEPIFILAYRDPASVLESMQKAYSMPIDWGQGLLDTRLVYSVVDTNCKFLPINYDNWFDSPTEVILSLSKACGIPKNKKVSALIENPSLAISPDLKRSLNYSAYRQKVPTHSQKMYELIEGFEKNRKSRQDLLNYCIYFKEFYDSLVYVSSNISGLEQRLETESTEGNKTNQLLEQIVADKEAILTAQKARTLEHGAFLASLEDLRNAQGTLQTKIQSVNHQGSSISDIASLLQQHLKLEKTEGYKTSQLLEQIVADKETILTTQKERALEHEAFLASLDELRKSQGSLKTEIQNVNHQSVSLNGIISILQKEYKHDREEGLQSNKLLTQLLNDKDTSLSALKDRIDEQTGVLSTLQLENSNKDKEISHLQHKIEQFNIQNRDIKNKNKNYRERNQTYREKEQYHSDKVVELRDRLTTVQKRLSEMENQSVLGKIFNK
ncbi:MAG: hypothetical protein L3J22_03315 [Xanthomonadales bacterium]|nr:hypothetical protein [Xanthomonadales bacterium]